MAAVMGSVAAPSNFSQGSLGSDALLLRDRSSKSSSCSSSGSSSNCKSRTVASTATVEAAWSPGHGKVAYRRKVFTPSYSITSTRVRQKQRVDSGGSGDSGEDDDDDSGGCSGGWNGGKSGGGDDGDASQPGDDGSRSSGIPLLFQAFLAMTAVETYLTVAAHHDGLPSLPDMMGKQHSEPDVAAA